MANFGARLAYPMRQEVAVVRPHGNARPADYMAPDVRPSSDGTFSNLGRALRALGRRLVAAQLRVAGPPWDGGQPTPGVFAMPLRPDAEG